MTTAPLTPETATEPAPADPDPEPVWHIVGDIQRWLDRLGMKVPRALCGELLAGEPDPVYGAPICRTCATLADWTEEQIQTARWTP